MEKINEQGVPGVDNGATIPQMLLRMFVTSSLFVLLILLLRLVHLLHSIRTIRRQNDPQSPGSPSFFGSCTKPLKTLVVLGSGGHTTEMLHLIRNLDPARYAPIVLVIATTDTTSLRRVQAYPHTLPFDAEMVTTYCIPRSREVGQSYLTSIGTTLYSFWFTLWLTGVQVQPDLLLVNGPGTCLPIALSAFLFRLVGWKTSKTVFIESFCRVTSLSLTGKLLYPLADLFLVCWEELEQKYPLTHLVTAFVPHSTTRTRNSLATTCSSGKEKGP
jgi:beta-1,4-N-acetylglucosaminyltransferase